MTETYRDCTAIIVRDHEILKIACLISRQKCQVFVQYNNTEVYGGEKNCLIYS